MSKQTQKFQQYTEGDKAALRSVRQEMAEKVGHDVPISDVIAAVEPDMETPLYLKEA